MKEASLGDDIQTATCNELQAYAKQSKYVYLTSIDESEAASSNGNLSYTMVKVCGLASVGGVGEVDAGFCEQLIQRLPGMFSNQAQLDVLELRNGALSASRTWHDCGGAIIFSVLVPCFRLSFLRRFCLVYH